MRLLRAGIRALEVCDQGFGTTDAVGGRAHDAAGISSSLTTRVEAWGRHRMARSDSGDSDR